MGNACDLVNKWKTGSPAEKTAKETWMPVGNLYSIDSVGSCFAKMCNVSKCMFVGLNCCCCFRMSRVDSIYFVFGTNGNFDLSQTL